MLRYLRRDGSPYPSSCRLLRAAVGDSSLVAYFGHTCGITALSLIEAEVRLNDLLSL